MNRTRILLLTLEFPPMTGGVARYLGALAHYFGERVEIVAEPEALLGKGWPQWIRTVTLLLRRRKDHDLVLTSHLLPIGTAAMIASLVTKKPYIVLVHGMDVRLASRTMWKRWLASRILHRARVVVANSNALARELSARFGIGALVVYPCIDVDKNVRSRKTVNTDSDRPLRLLTVSRLIERKGHLNVLMALAQLKQEGRIQPFRYDIVGDGPMRSVITQTAGQLHLDEVVLHGTVDDAALASFYSSAELFVMPVLDDPTDKEGFGLVFLEAAAYGVPSISTAIEGVNEAILDGQTGLLVPSGNRTALADAIAILASDPSLRQQLGSQARERTAAEFTCEQQFRKLEPYL